MKQAFDSTKTAQKHSNKISSQNLFNYVTILVSLAAVLLAVNANTISREANSISATTSEEANKISREAIDFQKASRSQDYVEGCFSDLYQNKDNLGVVKKLRNNELVADKQPLLQVVDSLEAVGSSFCQGTVWKYHLNITLKKTLADVCQNKQLYRDFSGKKNGLAMLCAEFFPESIFATTMRTENLSTCTFTDSSVLKSTQENPQ